MTILFCNWCLCSYLLNFLHPDWYLRRKIDSPWWRTRSSGDCLEIRMWKGINRAGKGCWKRQYSISPWMLYQDRNDSKGKDWSFSKRPRGSGPCLTGRRKREENETEVTQDSTVDVVLAKPFPKQTRVNGCMSTLWGTLRTPAAWAHL